MPATAKTQQENPFQALVSEFYQADATDRLGAEESFLKQLKRSPAKLAEMLPYIVSVAFDETWRLEQHSHRRIPTANPDDVSGLVSMARHNMRTLMDFPLPGGRRLGDASKDDVLAAGIVFHRNMLGNAKPYRWMTLIAEKIPTGKIVSDILDVAAISKLKNSADRWGVKTLGAG